MSVSLFSFDNAYARLPDRFYGRLDPTPVAAPKLIRVNDELARDLGIDPALLTTSAGVDVLSGNNLARGSEPLAMAYAGHQFGNWVPQLGDGRAILLGEVIDRFGVRRDIQLKGSGRTPFSRGGDGRAALGPVLREYAVSEAMAAMGVPTTRALAAVTTGDQVARETLLPGAILTRVANSHIRIGTFQYFAARQDTEAVRLLSDHAIARHYPEAASTANPYVAMLDAVVRAQAALVARWLQVGFIHGVMNTDNASIAGETIDYGPCAFMDTYHPATVYSSIDRHGRYAYANQPRIAHWNLTRLAQSLLPILDDDEERAVELAQASVNAFPALFQSEWLAGMRRKIGLVTSRDEDEALINDLLNAMAEGEADYTLTFRRLCELSADHSENDDRLRGLFASGEAFDAWAVHWRERLALEADVAKDNAGRMATMKSVNPAVIPRNHLVQEVIDAGLREDYAPFDELMLVLSKPFEDQPDGSKFTQPPRREQIVEQTFCGT